MMFSWLLIIVLIFIYFDKSQNQSKYITYKESPREILDKRYISGEIVEDEYKRKKQLLNRLGGEKKCTCLDMDILVAGSGE